MIAIRPHHIALASALPGLFIMQSLLATPAEVEHVPLTQRSVILGMNSALEQQPVVAPDEVLEEGTLELGAALPREVMALEPGEISPRGRDMRGLVMVDGLMLVLDEPLEGQQGLRVTRRTQAGVRWSLTMSGDVMQVFADEETPEVLHLLTYRKGDGEGLVTAVDMQRGDILWATRLDGFSRDEGIMREQRMNAFVKRMHIEGREREVLLVHGEEVREQGLLAIAQGLTTALDPTSGEVLFVLREAP